ncbi:MAG: aldehyde dehydrogenase family protein, partial [Chloroflexi bacterium]|nr:aldehyde dehydrogenase family protein [Chloroflexota bacterium]
PANSEVIDTVPLGGADDARAAVDAAKAAFGAWAGTAPDQRAALLRAMNPKRYGVIMPFPVGVSVGIVPWNFPITLMGTKVGPALAAGCPLIIKPASATPLTTIKIIGLLNEAGLPRGTSRKTKVWTKDTSIIRLS